MSDIRSALMQSLTESYEYIGGVLNFLLGTLFQWILITNMIILVWEFRSEIPKVWKLMKPKREKKTEKKNRNLADTKHQNKCCICNKTEELCQIYKDSLRSPGEISTEIYEIFHLIGNENWNHMAFYAIYWIIYMDKQKNNTFELLNRFIKNYNDISKRNKYKEIIAHFSNVLEKAIPVDKLPISFENKNQIKKFINNNKIFIWFCYSIYTKNLKRFQDIKRCIEKDYIFFPRKPKEQVFNQLIYGFRYSDKKSNVKPIYSISKPAWFRGGIVLSLFSKPEYNFIDFFDGTKTRVAEGKEYLREYTNITVKTRNPTFGIFKRYPLLSFNNGCTPKKNNEEKHEK